MKLYILSIDLSYFIVTKVKKINTNLINCPEYTIHINSKMEYHNATIYFGVRELNYEVEETSIIFSTNKKALYYYIKNTCQNNIKYFNEQLIALKQHIKNTVNGINYYKKKLKILKKFNYENISRK